MFVTLGRAVLGALILGATSVALAAPPATYPLEQVRRGQTGWGLTTFAGVKPERFTFEVVGVVRNMLPKQDIILVKSDDPKFAVTGFWRGMSGSPLFLDDKPLCAFSYGWSFNKIALGGCTPIEYMKREGLGIAPRGGGPGAGSGTPVPVPRAVASASDWAQFAPRGDVAEGLAALSPAPGRWLLDSPTPPRLAIAPPASAALETQLTPAVPLALGGFGAPAFAELAALFSGYGVMPVAGGSTGNTAAGSGPSAFELGGSISVALIRGDMSAASTGTVSYLDGTKVLAFGHPMFQDGEFYAPVSTAEVHTVIASAQSAFVMATPRRELGALVQDRQSMIMADTLLRSPMIPVDISVTTAGATGGNPTTGEFHVEVLDNKFWTPQLVMAALGNAVSYYLPDRDDVTMLVDASIRLRGLGEVAFTDYLYSGDGAASVLGGARGLRALVPILLNPFSPVAIERVEFKVDLRFAAQVGEIEEIRLPAAQLRAGQRAFLDVVLRLPGDRKAIERVPVDVPAAAAGAQLTLELSAGDAARLDTTSPTSLPDLLRVLRLMRGGNTWVATLHEPGDGVAVAGDRVRDLPGVAADRLRPGSRTQRVEAYRPLSQTESPATRVIVGSASMVIQIAR